jgi:hypothetical protein
MIGTCSHAITDEWFDSEEGFLKIKDFDREWNRAISCVLYCPKCAEYIKLQKDGRYLCNTKKDEDDWLSGVEKHKWMCEEEGEKE